ncbi:MAG: CHAD domain-containing protein [Planctomycetia bacterium]|nr:CHAD domain-containing protein [Planctomycetia bacterium]
MAREDSQISTKTTRRRPTRVARRLLESALGHVEAALTDAAGRDVEDAQRVHQLRVATRRAVAAIDWFSDLLPPRRARELRGALKAIRRACDVTRNCDVLLARLDAGWPAGESAGLRSSLAAQRAICQQAIVECCSLWGESGRLATRARRLVESIRWDRRHKGEREPEYARYVRRRLKKPVRRFVRAARADLHDDGAPHQFRIQSKKLRYSLELVGRSARKKRLHKLTTELSSLQERLGDYNDHVTARKMLARGLGANGQLSHRMEIADLLAAEGAWLGTARTAILDWWTPDKLRAIRRKCRRLFD